MKGNNADEIKIAPLEISSSNRACSSVNKQTARYERGRGSKFKTLRASKFGPRLFPAYPTL
jgi:hypothetical protein